MSWVYQVQKVKTEKKTGEPYVLVYYWLTRAAFTRAEKPAIEEDFIMQIRPIMQRAVMNTEGKTLRQSGVWASMSAPPDDSDPTVTEPVTIDLRAQIRDNIECFLKGNRDRRGNFTTIKLTDTSDPHGVLAKPEVSSLVGKDFDEPSVGVSP